MNRIAKGLLAALFISTSFSATAFSQQGGRFFNNNNNNSQFRDIQIRRRGVGDGIGTFQRNRPIFNGTRFNELRGIGGGQIGFPFGNAFAVPGGGSQGGGNVTTINQGDDAAVDFQRELLRAKPRPRAKIIRVTDEQKALGIRRAAGRQAKFEQDGDRRVFRFYRETEAYDERFPSVVYLDVE